MRSSSIVSIILELLKCADCHYTAYKIYEQVRPRLPATSPSTVYRSLERLVHAGLVSVSDMGTGAAVYELVTTDVHHHLVCEHCGGTITLPHQAVKDFFQALEHQSGFTITTNHLVLFGYCPTCKKRSSGKPA